MTFTLETVAASLAAHLAPVLPGVTFYEDPNQQDSQTPCMFLQQRYARMQLNLGRWERRIGLDLTYLEDYNLTDLQRRYERAAGVLDEVMELFSYTYDRDWRIDLDALHYKFELRVWNVRPGAFDPMRRMEYHEEVRDGGETIQP